MIFSDISKHLRKFRVGIAGAGGLGSNCAVSLVRTGVGTIVIADFDIIEESNLNRQFYFRHQVGMIKVEALRDNLLLIDPEINVIVHNEVLTSKNIPDIFKGCDVIVEAFDEAAMKMMIAETIQGKMVGVPLILGSGMAGWGNNEIITSRKIDDCLYLCGDETTEVSDETPPLAPRVGIVSNMQANIVVDILLGMKR